MNDPTLVRDVLHRLAAADMTPGFIEANRAMCSIKAAMRDTMIAFLDLTRQALGFRYAIEHMGVTEADIRWITPTGVHLWNHRFIPWPSTMFDDLTRTGVLAP